MFTSQVAKHENLREAFGRIGLFPNYNQGNKLESKCNLGVIIDVDTDSHGRYLIYNLDTNTIVHRGASVETKLNNILMTKALNLLDKMPKLKIISMSDATSHIPSVPNLPHSVPSEQTSADSTTFVVENQENPTPIPLLAPI